MPLQSPSEDQDSTPAPLPERYNPQLRFAVFNVSDPNGSLPVLSNIGDATIDLDSLLSAPNCSLVLNLRVTSPFQHRVASAVVKVSFQGEKIRGVSNTGGQVLKSFLFRGDGVNVLAHETLSRSPLSFGIPVAMLRSA